MDLNKLKTANELQARIKGLWLLKDLINSTQEQNVLNVEIGMRLLDVSHKMTDPAPLLDNYLLLSMEKDDSIYVINAIKTRMEQLEKQFESL